MARHPLVVKLKSGEYDGKDIMEAWLLIESLSSENSRLVEIAQEAYEADHSGSFKDWCDMIGYRLTTDSVSGTQK